MGINESNLNNQIESSSKQSKTFFQVLSRQLFITFARAVGLPFGLIDHKGYYLFLNFIKPVAPKNSFTTVNITPSTDFSVELNDPYWMRLVSPFYRYEPAIAFILHRAKTKDYLFIDGGANFGYWSLMVTSQELGANQCIAVEAFPSNYQRLTDNIAQNHRSIRCIHAALFSKDDEFVNIGISFDHASASIYKPGDISVTTISIDRIVEDISKPIIIKLDVEGAEIEALKGAKHTIENHLPLIIYEDHGKDSNHEVTRYVLDTLKLPVFFVMENGSIIQINSLEKLDEIKTRSHVGYNFFSTHPDSDFYGLFVR